MYSPVRSLFSGSFSFICCRCCGLLPVHRARKGWQSSSLCHSYGHKAREGWHSTSLCYGHYHRAYTHDMSQTFRSSIYNPNTGVTLLLDMCLIFYLCHEKVRRTAADLDLSCFPSLSTITLHSWVYSGFVLWETYQNCIYNSNWCHTTSPKPAQYTTFGILVSIVGWAWVHAHPYT